MPLYDFRCPNCGVVREVFAKYGDRAVTIDCARSDDHPLKYGLCVLERQLSAPAVQIEFRHRAAPPDSNKYIGAKKK